MRIQTSESEPQCEFCGSRHWAHTQRVESMWNKAKKRNRHQWGTHRQMVDGYLCDFMWRQRHKNKDLLSVLLNCIANYNSNNENIAL